MRFKSLLLISCTLLALAPAWLNVFGQAETNLRLIVGQDTLVIYVSAAAPTALAGLQLRIAKSPGVFQSFTVTEGFDSLTLTDNLAPPGACYVYRLKGTDAPLPSLCAQPSLIFIRDVSLVDVFWYDSVSNQKRSIAILSDGQPTGVVCSASATECPINYDAPMPTATISPTLTVTVASSVTLNPTVAQAPTNEGANAGGTPDLDATIAAPQALSAAQTATAASPTPTDDIDATVNAALTATAVDLLAHSPVTSNQQWKPITRVFGGVEMVLVPPGCFMMGSDDRNPDEKPINKQCFDHPFWIDKTEVTNAQFEQFGSYEIHKSYWNDPQRPRESIGWFEARDFCIKRGGRLPTESEWEYAARGPDNLQYPWGNEFVADNVIYHENANGQTAAVGSKPGGASWVGALDMSGNVWEWVSAIGGYESNTDINAQRNLRGGSWQDADTDSLRSAFLSWQKPIRLNYIGFRCARDYSK
jgi:formylglycine-generating enzyme required for sulfatase activity